MFLLRILSHTPAVLLLIPHSPALAPTIQNPVDTFAPLNAEATFSCVIAGSAIDVTWNGPNSVLPPPVNMEENGNITSNLTINVTDGSYEGHMYNCTVRYRYCFMEVTSTSATFFVILLPNIQPPFIASGVFDVGDSLSLTCVATTNYGTLSITWTGPTSDLQGTDVVVTENNRTNTLNISQLNSTTGGLYTCIATNEAGTDTTNATIFVRPVVGLTLILANSGEDVTLTCDVQRFPPISIRWEKQNSVGVYEIFQNDSEHNLTFAPVVHGDEGIYRCVVTPEGFSEQASTTVALITVSPQASLAEASINRTYFEGETVLLQCTSKGGPNNTYQWQVNGTESDGETTQNLTRSNAMASTGGIYTCSVSNEAGSDNDSTYVFVHPYIDSDPQSNAVATGSMVVLICGAEGFPSPEYVWLRSDGRGIRDDILTNGRNLNISSVEYEDQGGYYCNVSSTVGTVESRVAVITGR